MKKRKLLIIAAGLILIAGILFYFSKAISLNTIFKTKSAESAKTQPSEHQGHTGGAIQTQTQQPSDTQAAEEEPPTVEIPPEKQQLIGVKTAEASIKPLQKIIRTVGRIEYDERKLSTVNTKFEGWIEKLYVDYTGRYVKKGEPLAEIYSPELLATQQEFINLLKWAKQSTEDRRQKTEIGTMLSRDAESIIEAAKQRLRLWDITDSQIKKIEETGKPIKTLTMYSPASGYVVQKTALQGMRVMPGEKLFDVADLSTVWVVSDIYEYELPLIKTGQRANISLSYFPGKEFSSTIDYVYPTLSGETRTAKVRFAIPNPGGQLKPQMFTNVEVKINLGKRLAIPEDAVIDTGTRQIVYVDKGEGYFEPREVMLGLKADGMVEVLKGLKAGEKIASAANFLIDSEAKLKGIVK
ncbi:MAG: efflux RND transporter periplasmic adaptor subunit [Nitrospirae bacterium]|nr:efflux RND transporter periplasmic adaptor subunit [Nitrospirota bacterium]